MKRDDIKRRIYVLICLGLVVLGLHMTSIAQEQTKIDISAIVGFSDKDYLSRPGCWTPVNIFLDNKEWSINGKFELRSPDDSHVYTIPFSSPQNSVMLFPGYLCPEGLAGGKNEYTLTLNSPDCRIQPLLIPVQTLKDEDYYIVAMSGEDGSLRYLNYLLNKEVNKNLPEDVERIFVRICYTNSFLLPRNAMGYQAVSSVIWDGGNLMRLDTDQARALREWIECGGSFFVFVGENWQQLRGTDIEKILGVQFTGSKLVTLADSGGDGEKGAIVVSLTNTLKGWNVIYTINDQPLFAQRNLGLGTIYYCSARFTELLPNQNEIMQCVKDARADRVFLYNKNKIREQISYGLSGIREIFNIKLPSFRLVFGFLLSYFIIIVAINYIIFKMLKRLEWAWYCIPVIALIFSGILYGYAYLSYGQSYNTGQTHYIKTVAGSSSGLAHSGCILFSPMKKDLTIKPRNIEIFPSLIHAVNTGWGRPRVSYMGATQQLNLCFDRRFTIEDLTIYKWSERSFGFESIANLGGGILVDLEKSDESFDYTLDNKTPYTFNSCVLLTKFGTSDLLKGMRVVEIQSGETRSGSIPISAMDELRDDPSFSYSGVMGRNPYNPFWEIMNTPVPDGTFLSSNPLAGNNAVLLLKSEDFRIHLEGAMSDNINISRSVFFVQCPIQFTGKSNELRNSDFSMLVTPSKPTTNGMYPNIEERKSFMSYGEQCDIHFVPIKSPALPLVNQRFQLRSINLKICLNPWDERYLPESEYYHVFAYNYKSNSWTPIDTGSIYTEEEGNCFYNPTEGIKIQIRFNLELIHKFFPRPPHSEYNEKDVFLINNIAFRISGENPDMPDNKEQTQ